MNQTEYEEDIVYRRLSCVKTLIEDGNMLEKDLLEQTFSLLETILQDNWWEIGGRISRSKTMFGTGYTVRYELVKNNWSERSACAALGCWQKRRWPL